MPGTKAAAALAASVVSVAAALTSLGGPGASGPATPSPGAAASTTATSTSSPASTTTPAPARTRTGRPTVFFAETTAMLRPAAGPAASFACRAASRLAWRCLSGGAAAAGASSADLLVVVAGPADDATDVTAALDVVAPAAGDRPVVLLGPVLPTDAAGPRGSDPAAVRRLAGIRALAERRALALVDPVAGDWVPAARTARWLTASGTQLTGSGHVALAVPLAAALRTQGQRAGLPVGTPGTASAPAARSSATTTPVG